jgi:hypothetical protein
MPQCYPGSDLVLLAASIAVALSEGLSADDTNVLSGLIVAIGDNLAIIAAQKQLCEEAGEANNDSAASETISD